MTVILFSSSTMHFSKEILSLLRSSGIIEHRPIRCLRKVGFHLLPSSLHSHLSGARKGCLFLLIPSREG